MSLCRASHTDPAPFPPESSRVRVGTDEGGPARSMNVTESPCQPPSATQEPLLVEAAVYLPFVAWIEAESARFAISLELTSNNAPQQTPHGVPFGTCSIVTASFQTQLPNPSPFVTQQVGSDFSLAAVLQLQLKHSRRLVSDH